MTVKNRLFAVLLAVCLTSGVGIAAAAPVQAAPTMGYKNLTVTKSGYSSKTACQSAERATANSIEKSGGIIFAGGACGYWGKAKKWGFSMTYKKRVPIAS